VGSRDDPELELVGEFYEAWNSGMALEEFGERFMSDDVEWHDQPELPDSRVHRGREAVLGMLAELEAAFGRAHCEIRMLERSGGEVVASFTLHGAGAYSGLVVAPVIAHLLRVRDGRITRIRAFFTLEGAFFKAHAGGD
jgi:ketosteroid isomerase-like protein